MIEGKERKTEDERNEKREGREGGTERGKEILHRTKMEITKEEQMEGIN